MFEFFKRKKEVPENKVSETKDETEKKKVMGVISEVQSAREAEAKKYQQAHEKMRPDVREMYQQMLDEAKRKGDTKKQQIYEAALDELDKQISKDQEKQG